MHDLGEILYVSGFWVVGDMTVVGCGDLIEAVIKAINMETAHGSIVWHYPVQGKGGVGFTIAQPITTSLITMDVWPKADVPHGALIIQSCKHFEDMDVIEAIHRMGFDYHDKFDGILRGKQT